MHIGNLWRRAALSGCLLGFHVRLGESTWAFRGSGFLKPMGPSWDSRDKMIFLEGVRGNRQKLARSTPEKEMG